METENKRPIVTITPKDFIIFKTNKEKETSQLSIENNHTSDICFKIKTSSPKEFIVLPCTGLIKKNKEVSVIISFVGSPDLSARIHKFLIQIAPGVDQSTIDWRSKEVKEFRIATKFLVSDQSILEKSDSEVYSIKENESFQLRQSDNFSLRQNESFNLKQSGSINIRESIYSEIEENKEDIKLLEDEKRQITERNSELISEIDKIRAEIENANRKYKFTKDIDIISEDMSGNYSILHLVLSVIIGFLVGYLILG